MKCFRVQLYNRVLQSIKVVDYDEDMEMARNHGMHIRTLFTHSNSKLFLSDARTHKSSPFTDGVGVSDVWGDDVWEWYSIDIIDSQRVRDVIVALDLSSLLRLQTYEQNTTFIQLCRDIWNLQGLDDHTHRIVTSL